MAVREHNVLCTLLVHTAACATGSIHARWCLFGHDTLHTCAVHSSQYLGVWLHMKKAVSHMKIRHSKSVNPNPKRNPNMNLNRSALTPGGGCVLRDCVFDAKTGMWDC